MFIPLFFITTFEFAFECVIEISLAGKKETFGTDADFSYTAVIFEIN